MRKLLVVVAAMLLALLMAASVRADVTSVSKEEAASWVRWTVPLPKSIDIASCVTVAKGAVALAGPGTQDLVTEETVKELNEAVGGPATKADFTITLAIGGPDSEPLKSLKNSNQAYRIFPVGSDGKELKLVALTSRGLYYAAKTLQQLINGRATKDTVVIPMVTVTDWPDLEERGLWGSDNFDHMRWMGDRKMNLAEQISDNHVDERGVAHARMKAGRETLIYEGPKYGINGVPVVLHLEQSSGGRGVLKAYPELKAKSEKEGLMCYSQPKSVEIIADWIAELASLPNVTDVDVWMSENLNNLKGCQCDLCKATGVDPMVLEARAIVKAWQMAERKTGKKIGIRTLTSEASEDFNKQIFAELPKEVKVIYYHSLLTYTSGRSPMLFRPYLEEYAKSGHWLGVCPNISPVVGFTQPWTSAQFVQYRCKEFVDKGLSCLMGYSTPRVHYAAYATEAAAEYSWNVNGRSTREFAASYAVRKGIKDPEKFADFAEAVGQVEWDYVGSQWPDRADNWLGQKLAERFQKGTVQGLGEVLWDFIRFPFGNVKSVSQLDRNVNLAARAVKLADEMGIEEYKQEARVAQGFTRSQKALYELTRLAPRGTMLKENLYWGKRYFQMFADGLRQSCDALPKWEACVRRPTDPGDWTGKVVKICNEKVLDPMLAVAKKMGVEVK